MRPLEVRALQPGLEGRQRPFARVPGVDAFALGKAPAAAVPVHLNRALSLQVHLDARGLRAERAMRCQSATLKSLPNRRLRCRSRLTLEAAVTPCASS